MRIFKPIEPFFQLNCQNKILIQMHNLNRWKLSGQFNPDSYPVYNQLSQEFKLKVDYFQSTI